MRLSYVQSLWYQPCVAWFLPCRALNFTCAVTALAYATGLFHHQAGSKHFCALLEEVLSHRPTTLHDFQILQGLSKEVSKTNSELRLFVIHLTSHSHHLSPHIHITSQSHHFTFTSFHITSHSHHLTFTLPHIHMASHFHYLTFTSHHIFTTSHSHYLTFTSPHIHTTSHFHCLTFASPHIHITHIHTTSHSHHLTFASPRIDITSDYLTFTSPHIHITSLSHHVTFTLPHIHIYLTFTSPHSLSHFQLHTLITCYCVLQLAGCNPQWNGWVKCDFVLPSCCSSMVFCKSASLEEVSHEIGTFTFTL
jgi:hypothetical protein